MQVEREIIESLTELGLWTGAGTPAVQALAGGVSCDVFRIDLDSGPVCVKRALPRLRVAVEWTAPVERVRNEAAWLRFVEGVGAVGVPHVIAEDTPRHLFVMSFFDPATHPNWKAELAAGRVDAGFARAVGAGLVRIHAASADIAGLARRFSTDATFEALRIEPYLRYTARAHPDLRGEIEALADSTLACKRALVHGDVSPKNILVGPDGPVMLDAECAWFGDPAFDIAFCATHLLLKSVWRPQYAPGYLAAFDAFRDGYFRGGISWEPPEALEHRATRLLAAFLLARIDGKSPVEYLTAESDHAAVRRRGRAMLTGGAESLEAARALWTADLEQE